jgi:hypothetical protein
MARTRQNQEVRRDMRRWTAEEDARILRHVKARPQNLNFCFTMVAEEIGRTKGAVSNRWYTVVSKKPEALCFFTASPYHVSKNRKNGVGVESNASIWRRLMAVIRNII